MRNSQFWVQSAIQMASVVATLFLAVIAIWGAAIRARLVGPRLRLSLLNPKGERIDLTGGIASRYYHLRVENTRRSAYAENVRVVITRIVRPAADGSIPKDTLSGSIQLTWQHGHSLPQYPTLGPPMNCDLGCLVKDNVFRLSLMFVPNNVSPDVKPGETIRVEAIAISDQTESKPLALEIAWDGEWHEDSNELAKHLVVKEVNT